ncbi:hypothetical protein WDZ92_24485, partial [Nostoc sp. NIES-2111]
LCHFLIYCETSYKLRGVQFLSLAHHSTKYPSSKLTPSLTPVKKENSKSANTEMCEKQPNSLKTPKYG